MKALIVGGGIGGLCLAQGLKKAGIEVAVFERDRTPTERLQGYRIHIDPDGSTALHACFPEGLFDRFLATCGKPGRGFRMITHQQHELFHVPADPEQSAKEGHHAVGRANLREVLLTGLEGMVSFGKRFSHYEMTPDGRVTAFFDDGSSATADLLVGSDGVHSRVRKQFLPHAELLDTGVSGIAGKVPLRDAFSFFDCATMISGPNTDGMFVAPQEVEPGSGESSYVFWAYSARRETFPQELVAEDGLQAPLFACARSRIHDWHPSIRNLVDHTDVSTIASWRIRSSLPIAPWKTGRVTLLGDAIHNMTPFRGIGANIALKDAQKLCEALIAANEGRRPLESALHQYETEMLDYGFAAVKSSLEALHRLIPPSNDVK